MSYEVINKELQLDACNIGDLTMDLTKMFLELWGGNSAISTLTLFLKDDGTVVLNKDRADYELYKDIAICFLGETEDYRKQMREKVPEGMLETLNTLESAIERRKMVKTMEILEHCSVVHDEVGYGLLKHITDKYGMGPFGLIQIFNLGIIWGKRADRARRKKGIR